MPYDDRVGLGARPASASVAAVESTVGRRVDHVMAIDWQTFAALAADNDVDAAYRYGSAPVAQHDYLRLVLEGTLHAELRKQPLALYRALRTTASGVAIDDTWSVAGARPPGAPPARPPLGRHQLRRRRVGLPKMGESPRGRSDRAVAVHKIGA